MINLEINSNKAISSGKKKKKKKNIIYFNQIKIVDNEPLSATKNIHQRYRYNTDK